MRRAAELSRGRQVRLRDGICGNKRNGLERELGEVWRRHKCQLPLSHALNGVLK